MAEQLGRGRVLRPTGYLLWQAGVPALLTLPALQQRLFFPFSFLLSCPPPPSGEDKKALDKFTAEGKVGMRVKECQKAEEQEVDGELIAFSLIF